MSKKKLSFDQVKKLRTSGVGAVLNAVSRFLCDLSQLAERGILSVDPLTYVPFEMVSHMCEDTVFFFCSCTMSQKTKVKRLIRQWAFCFGLRGRMYWSKEGQGFAVYLQTFGYSTGRTSLMLWRCVLALQ